MITPSAALGVVAEELGGAEPCRAAGTTAFSVAASPVPDQAARALAFCCCMAASKAVGVDGDAAGAQRVLRQIEREAIGVVKREGDIAAQALAGDEILRGVVQQRQAARQRGAEAGLLELQRLR